MPGEQKQGRKELLCGGTSGAVLLSSAALTTSCSEHCF